MNKHTLKQGAVLIVVAALAAGAGVWWARRDGGAMPTTDMPASKTSDSKKALYWYDPMYPQQRFDAPGKSPFMDMQLVPKYAEAGAGSEGSGLRIDPLASQNLGMRLAPVTRGAAVMDIAANGVLAFSERDVAIVQAKRAGYVERVFPRAPGDVIAAGAPLVNVLVPEWVGAQREFLALLGLGDPSLIEAGRARLRLMGMPEPLIRRVERRRQTQTVSTIDAPIGGVIQTLDVRAGMTLAAGQTLARINGLDTVWLDVAVEETQTANVHVGQHVTADLAAYPGELFSGKVSAILPEANPNTRGVRVRVVLPNRNGRLKPNLTAEVHITTGNTQDTLRVPSEALIRTGKRTLVMLAEPGGRYRPVEVSTGTETGEYTAILAGLNEGQQVVTSGQFLLDSEASLTGMIDTTQKMPQSTPAVPLHAAEGRIIELSKKEVTIEHGPFKTLNMPGMTMSFTLARPELAQSLKIGDRVQFSVREAEDGLVVERIDKMGKKP